MNAEPLDRLIEQFARLNGIGRKSAARLAYQVLGMEKEDARAFAQAILDAQEKIHRCRVCQNLTEDEVCAICDDPGRDAGMICVVESPRDVSAFEHTREYKGHYHVLHGLISPAEGIGPDQLPVQALLDRLRDGSVHEVIMATNPNVEGEATAMYLARLIKPLGVQTTRLAYGLPVNGSLEYIDDVTLFRAFEGRGEM
ncbi:recombination mediator RecR [Ruminococcaceae bacterium OttesenSCG-928-I18]|nr:recombination mediator RecR [Ruminococcaceae bacterium OttesenSCG-928-I18]